MRPGLLEPPPPPPPTPDAPRLPGLWFPSRRQNSPFVLVHRFVQVGHRAPSRHMPLVPWWGGGGGLHTSAPPCRGANCSWRKHQSEGGCVCGVRGVCVRCAWGVRAVCVGCVRCVRCAWGVCGVCAVCVRCVCGVCAVCVRCVCSVCAVCVQCAVMDAPNCGRFCSSFGAGPGGSMGDPNHGSTPLILDLLEPPPPPRILIPLEPPPIGCALIYEFPIPSLAPRSVDP